MKNADINAPFETGDSPNMMSLAANKANAALSNYVMVSTLVRQARNTWTARKAKSEYYVSVSKSDDIYYPVHEWLMTLIPAEDLRSLIAYTKRRENNKALDENDRQDMVLRYDGEKRQKVTIGSHIVWVEVDKGSRGTPTNMEQAYAMASAEAEKITFTCETMDARDSVIEFLRNIAHKVRRDKARLYISAKWGGWDYHDAVARRELSTVVLPEGQKERIRADLGRFLEDEEAYARFGLPYHRGYLFHGPPGTGKTSLARALATEFNLDLYFLPLTDLNKDAQLSAMFADVEPRSILLLEDIDVLKATKSRTSEKDTVSLSGLLNALDGVVTPHGLITIMTTNDLTALDKALTRFGRIDVKEELGYLTPGQFSELVFKLTGETVEPEKVKGETSPAELIESLKAVLHGGNITEALSRFII